MTNIYTSNLEKAIVYIKDPSLFSLSSPISCFGRNQKTTYKQCREYRAGFFNLGTADV